MEALDKKMPTARLSKHFVNVGHLDCCRVPFHNATSNVRTSYAADTLL